MTTSSPSTVPVFFMSTVTLMTLFLVAVAQGSWRF